METEQRETIVKIAPSERRRYRRIPLPVQVLAKRAQPGEPGESDRFQSGLVQDVSLAGVYFTTPAWKRIEPQEMLTVSISVPREQSRDFPFSRLVGRGRVVRVQPVEGETPNTAQLGIALEFADDLTVLAAAPEHGW